MHRAGLVLLVLAHVARSEVVVSNFTALQNAIADGAVIRITSSFDWTDEVLIRSVDTVTITNDEGVKPILDRQEGGRFFRVEKGGTLVVSGLTFKNGRVKVSRCLF